ncbi:hypothetical protein [Streptomyces venezuelae]|uniref:hypothetical protein n=1 Tax=Streptomyces venezuelae TaxID=54571 RepID=UPI001CC954EF|nr:hypothetical protein [Streptomyces venezuelae]
MAILKSGRASPTTTRRGRRTAITHCNSDLDETTAVALLRLELEHQPVPDDSGWSREFEQLTSMVAARAQQVQNA